MSFKGIHATLRNSQRFPVKCKKSNELNFYILQDEQFSTGRTGRSGGGFPRLAVPISLPGSCIPGSNAARQPRLPGVRPALQHFGLPTHNVILTVHRRKAFAAPSSPTLRPTIAARAGKWSKLPKSGSVVS